MCAKIISVANRKGGVGKTTVTINLGYVLCEMGFRCLVVDLSSQANLSKGLGAIEIDREENTINAALQSVMDGEEVPPLQQLVRHYGKLDFIGCNQGLSALEQQLVVAMRREYVLQRVLDSYKNQYDFILLDSDPALGLWAVNILVASDSVLIVGTPTDDSMEGIRLLVGAIQRVRRGMGHPVEIEGIVLNEYAAAETLSRETSDELLSIYQEAVTIFKTTIPKTTIVPQCKKRHISIFEYKPQNKASKITSAYWALAEEFVAAGGYRRKGENTGEKDLEH